MKSLNEHIINLLADGKYFFSQQGVLTDLGISPIQFKFQAHRLVRKGSIKRLRGNFYMIIPAEYSHIGSLPPHWIVDSLMKYLDQQYYIGLLSAASFYGATEQQPMTFQVITNKITRAIDLGRGRIEFHVFKYCSESLTSTISAPTGYAKISTKEQTMLDLISFYEVSGHMSNVAMVIKSLAEECDSEVLSRAVKIERTNPVLQRLGYILEISMFPKLARVIENELSTRKIKYVQFRPDLNNKGGEKLDRWKLILNDVLEIS